MARPESSARPAPASVDSLLRQRESLREVIEEISSQLELRPLLTSIVRHACELIGAQDGSIGLHDEARGVIRIEAIWRMPEAELGMELPAGVGLLGQVLLARAPVVLDHYGAVPQPTRPELAENPVIGVPIFWRDRLIGACGIGGRAPRRFGPGDVEMLALYARHAAVAVENARLYERARQMAVLEERNRLARDLHDSVTQKLFSMSLIAQSLAAAWHRDAAEGERRTERLVEVTGAALAEMRALLAELRPPEAAAGPAALPAAEPLPAALRRLARESSRDGLEVGLVLRGCGERERLGEAALEEHLTRIAQEALANVVKHARAGEATILLAREGGRIELGVADDGVGFDAASWLEPDRRGGAAGHGLGLAGMRERAAALGGRLRVVSRPGGGTTVKVVVYQGRGTAR